MAENTPETSRSQKKQESIEVSEFLARLKEIREYVHSWPEWKQEVLGNLPRKTDGKETASSR